MSARTASRRGFTMVEVIMVILLTAILASAAVPVILAGIDALHYDQKRNNLVETARFVMDRIGLEVQGIQHLEGPSTALPDDYRFASNRYDAMLCADGDLPTARTVGFWRQGNELMEQVTMTCDGSTTGETATLSSFIQDLSFTYYGADGAELPAPVTGAGSDIEAVRVRFTLRDPQLTGRFEAPYTIVGEFRPRNMQREEEFLP